MGYRAAVILFAFVILYTSNLLYIPPSGIGLVILSPDRNYTYMDAVKANLGTYLLNSPLLLLNFTFVQRQYYSNIAFRAAGKYPFPLCTYPLQYRHLCNVANIIMIEMKKLWP